MASRKSLPAPEIEEIIEKPPEKQAACYFIAPTGISDLAGGGVDLVEVTECFLGAG